ncbi:MAG TPA: hypothetical protein PKO36_05835 [Candidatus Hydrogenedentes bacterium]|nr:hypothetical protein [Candidatus Hydrogenedentota bacterium]HOV72665.1 hypothetical protein [Candidatus Hydrogenedentota bacterium]HPC16463.1 hypothetical protein [Candidatus Hydrogenedentota bacterium]HRT20174.1 hypothetical protein [Candidatus Hydrogenedentota bacterium]HRT63208.1 hypothetical protein [Candidatus Hydrogenedentota bacterium]
MIGRRFKAINGIVCLAVNVAGIAYAGHGAVLCIAHDHVAIESSFQGGCCGGTKTAEHPERAIFASLKNTPIGNPAACGPCMDIPFASEYLASASHAPRIPEGFTLEIPLLFSVLSTGPYTVSTDSVVFSSLRSQRIAILRI